MVDGQARASRVVGSAEFVRPASLKPDDSLTEVTGTMCSMPFSIKYRDSQVSKDEVLKTTQEVFQLAELTFSRYIP